MRRLSASATDATEGHGAASGASGAPAGRAGMLVAGRYRLESLIARGAMGEVWRARHEELNTELAVKLANEIGGDELADRMLERFRFEAQVTAQLAQHTEHVVTVHDAGRHRGVPYLAMEYVPGMTLAAAIDRGRLTPERVADILDQLANALDVAHARGIWHRDIKPANIMLTPRADGRELVKLADFGVAKAIEAHLDVDRPRTTELGMLVGTPAYMSPQQIAGKAMDARCDLWSLAVCAYEALTGKEPFGELELSDLLRAIATQPFEPPSGVPKGLHAWFARALHKHPERRFATARELARAFRAAIAPPRERWRAAWVAAAVVLGAAAAAAWSWHRSEPAAPLLPSMTAPKIELPRVSTSSTPPTPAPAPSIEKPSIEKPKPSAAPPRPHAYDKSETL